MTTRWPYAYGCRATTRVLIEVWDAGPQQPVLKDLGEDGTPGPQEEGGRGLFLVAALSTRWDWYLTEEPMGKVVWCELSIEPPESSEGAQSAPQALLPRRMPHEQQKQPIEEVCDPDVLLVVQPGVRQGEHVDGSGRGLLPARTLGGEGLGLAGAVAGCHGEVGRAGRDVSQSRWAGCSRYRLRAPVRALRYSGSVGCFAQRPVQDACVAEPVPQGVL
jgi:hypothetical protein